MPILGLGLLLAHVQDLDVESPYFILQIARGGSVHHEILYLSQLPIEVSPHQ